MQHQCFVCNPDNPERISRETATGGSFEFVERFVGPRGRAHGGISVGALTCPALQSAELDGMKHPIVKHVIGRLHRPVPLSHPIQVRVEKSENGYQVELSDDAIPLVSGSVDIVDRQTMPGDMLQEPPEERVKDLEALSLLADANLTGPTLAVQQRQALEKVGYKFGQKRICFGCAETPEALQLYNRATVNGDLWTRWEVEPSFIDSDGQLATAIIVAALDCSHLWVLNTAIHPDLGVKVRTQEKKFFMTGTYGVRIVRIPPMDVPGGYRVVAHYLRIEGRKGFTMSVLLDGEGTIYAFSDSLAILIDIPPEMFGQS